MPTENGGSATAENDSGACDDLEGVVEMAEVTIRKGFVRCRSALRVASTLINR